MRKLWILLALSLFTSPAFAFDIQGDERVTFTRQDEITATTTSTEVLPANGQRRYLLIVNKGATAIYVKFGSASAGTDGIYIPAGGNYEPFKVSLQSVFIKAASGTPSVIVVEAI